MSMKTGDLDFSCRGWISPGRVIHARAAAARFSAAQRAACGGDAQRLCASYGQSFSTHRLHAKQRQQGQRGLSHSNGDGRRKEKEEGLISLHVAPPAPLVGGRATY